MHGDFICKDGVVVHAADGSFVCSDKTTYRLAGQVLLGPDGVVSRYCADEAVALDIIVGRHGGPR